MSKLSDLPIHSTNIWQSQRTAIYREHAERLLDTGRAYRCFCTPERLYSLAQERHKFGLPADYDRHCTHVSKEESDDRASKGEAHVVRLLSPEVYPQFTDIVHGRIRNPVINSKAKLYPAWSDPILLKSDGFPTYHLANVIDDHLMHITHVIRGSEWMSSTPKHLALYDAFSWTPPLFAHVGLLVDKDRQKLSKRKLDIDISAFRDKLGVFPEALNNYVALLGWSHSQTSDVMSLPALISNFSLKFTTGETIVAFEKLWFLQRAHAERYVRSGSPIVSDMVLRILQAHETAEAERLAKSKSVPGTIESEEMNNGPKIDGEYVERLLTLDARNYTTASEFYLRNTYYFHRPSPTTLRLSYPPLQLHNVQASFLDMIDAPQAAVKALEHIFDVGKDEWMEDKLKARVQETIRKQVEEWEESVKGAREQEGLMKKWAKVVHRLVRWTLCAGLPGPDGAATMVLLGREEVLRRAGTALKVLEEPGDGAKGPKTEGRGV